MHFSCALLGGFVLGAQVLRCCGNITRTRNVSDYVLLLALCLVRNVGPPGNAGRDKLRITVLQGVANDISRPTFCRLAAEALGICRQLEAGLRSAVRQFVSSVASPSPVGN